MVESPVPVVVVVEAGVAMPAVVPEAVELRRLPVAMYQVVLVFLEARAAADGDLGFLVAVPVHLVQLQVVQAHTELVALEVIRAATVWVQLLAVAVAALEVLVALF